MNIGIEHCAIMAAAYIGDLEIRINRLAGKTITTCQTKVVPYYTRRRTSPFSIAFGVVTLVLLVLFGFSFHWVIGDNQSPFFLALRKK